MNTQEELEFFYDDTVRKLWHVQEEEWYFSIIDVCQVLTDSAEPRKYWNKLKHQLSEEGFETSTISRRFKLKAKDGKMRMTDCANTEQLLRIIQSIPSKKAEPFKQWLARVGKERLDELADPELAVQRGIAYYKAKGYSDAWITQRMRTIEMRKELTDEWQRAGISDNKDYAILTNILTQTWSGKTVQQYKKLKGLHKENLRDNMTNTELVLNQLAEVSTTELSKNANPKGYQQTKDITIQGGEIAKGAREALEKQLGRSVLSPLNANTPNLLDDKDS
ncbi:MAG: hypothetical protein HFJ06_02960 [Lachnospiraceae bacterium]|nr:hypothetical protein [Lachnospiraceae bacterium]